MKFIIIRFCFDVDSALWSSWRYFSWSEKRWTNWPQSILPSGRCSRPWCSLLQSSLRCEWRGAQRWKNEQSWKTWWRFETTAWKWHIIGGIKHPELCHVVRPCQCNRNTCTSSAAKHDVLRATERKTDTWEHKDLISLHRVAERQRFVHDASYMQATYLPQFLLRVCSGFRLPGIWARSKSKSLQSRGKKGLSRKAKICASKKVQSAVAFRVSSWVRRLLDLRLKPLVWMPKT